MTLIVTPFFDPATHSYSYVLLEPASLTCAIIDPVLDYDPDTGSISTTGADEIVAFVKANGLIVEWLLETHVHADHLSASRYLKSRFVCAQHGIGAGIAAVAQWVDPESGLDAGAAFDRLFEDGDRISLGHASGRVLATPGHTPGCVSYRFENLLFVGDTLFMPDYGTARCDFPGGDAATLYRSIQRILGLPGNTKLFMCHDYAPGGRPFSYLSTVQAEQRDNIHVKQGISEMEFIRFRSERDAQLDDPALLDPAVAFNLSGGSAAVLNRSADSRAA